MRQTTNYKLPSWDSDDRILRTDFNDLTEKVDSALKSQADSISSLSSQMGGTASSGTVNSLSSKLDQEIQDRKNADTAEAQARADAISAEKAAREAADTAEATARAQGDAAEAAARTAALALKGNCQIYFSSYVGDGAETKTLTFPGKPLLVNVQGDNLIGQGIYGNPNFMCRTSGTYGLACSATWTENSLSWKIFDNSPYGCNSSGQPYLVIALMAMDE